MLANSDTVILGLGDSYMQGSEAGDPNASFINQYCNLKGFDCVNLGQEGIGNLGSVFMAFIYDIDWSQWKNKYLFWMPTGLNRFDMADKEWEPDSVWTARGNPCIFTPFPNEQPHTKFSVERQNLEKSLSHFVTPQTVRQDFLTAYQIMKTFYDAKGFNKLFIFPAFSDETLYYNMKFLRKTETTQGIYKINNDLFNRMGWKQYIKVDDCTNYFMWLCKQANLPLTTKPSETISESRGNIRNDEVEKWIAPGSHATAKGNIVFSRRLVEVLNI